jgi:small subunit ribosomal protein S5
MDEEIQQWLQHKPGARERRQRRDRRDRRDDRPSRRRAARRAHIVERVVAINRVAKVVKGGRRFSFTALVVVGDGDGMVGVGYGKAKEVPAGDRRRVSRRPSKNFFRVPRIQGTIPHPVTGEAAAGVVAAASWHRPVPVLSPVVRCAPCSSAPASTTCCPSRSGSDNAINIVHATVAALKMLERPKRLPLAVVCPRGCCPGRICLRAKAAEVGA